MLLELLRRRQVGSAADVDLMHEVLRQLALADIRRRYPNAERMMKSRRRLAARVLSREDVIRRLRMGSRGRPGMEVYGQLWYGKHLLEILVRSHSCVRGLTAFRMSLWLVIRKFGSRGEIGQAVDADIVAGVQLTQVPDLVKTCRRLIITSTISRLAAL